MDEYGLVKQLLEAEVPREILDQNTEFLQQLLTSNQTLDEIINLPTRLLQTRNENKLKLFSFLFKQYNTFIQTNSCKKALVQINSQISKVLQQSFPEDRPDDNLLTLFHKAAIEFNGLQFLNERKRTALIMNQQVQLLELLEIPQLLDTFTKNGYYEEAMDLQLYVHRLLIRHPNLPLIKKIAAQVTQETCLMLAQLTQLLSGNIKLPLCIRVIGYLRRMDSFPEPELRILFLQQRNAYLHKLINDIKEIDQEDSFEYLKKFIEIYREHFFDIVTQYKAIFSDSMTSVGYSSNDPCRTAVFLSDFSSSLCTSSILSSFVLNAQQMFQRTLKERVPLLKDTNLVNSIMTQTMYYGMSLGRIGIDFRQTISPIFENAVQKIITEIINQGVQEFINFCRKSNLVNVKSAFTTTESIPVSSSTNLQTITPPNQILNYPFLAHLLNIYFTSFNQLRLMPSISLLEPIGQLIQTTLSECTVVLNGIGMDDSSFWSIYKELFVPAVVNGFKKIYGKVTLNDEIWNGIVDTKAILNARFTS